MSKLRLTKFALLASLFAGACATDAAGPGVDDDPTPPDQEEPDPNPNPEPEDDVNTDPTRVRVTVIDVFGNPSPGANVVLHDDEGAVALYQLSNAEGVVEGELSNGGSATVLGQVGNKSRHSAITLGSLQPNSEVVMPDPAGGKALNISYPSYASNGDEITYRFRAGCNQATNSTSAGSVNLYIWRPSCAVGDVLQIFAEVRINERTAAYAFAKDVPLSADSITINRWKDDDKFKSVAVNVKGFGAVPGGWDNYSGTSSHVRAGARFRLALGQYRDHKNDPHPVAKLAKNFGTPVLHSRFAWKTSDDLLATRSKTIRSLSPSEATLDTVVVSHNALPMTSMVHSGTIVETTNPDRPLLSWASNGIELESSEAMLRAIWFDEDNTRYRWYYYGLPTEFTGSFRVPAMPEALADYRLPLELKELALVYSRTMADDAERPVYAPEQWPRMLGANFLRAEREVFFY